MYTEISQLVKRKADAEEEAAPCGSEVTDAKFAPLPREKKDYGPGPFVKLLKGDFSFSYSDVLRAVATGPELTRATFRKSAKSKILNVENAEKRCNFSKFLDFNSIFIMIIPEMYLIFD